MFLFIQIRNLLLDISDGFRPFKISQKFKKSLLKNFFLINISIEIKKKSKQNSDYGPNRSIL